MNKITSLLQPPDPRRGSGNGYGSLGPLSVFGGGEPMRVGIYTRVSKDDRLDQDINSLEAQRTLCERYIASFPAGRFIILPKHYDDAGISAKDLNRPMLQELLADMDSGLVNCVAILRQDRISRNLFDTLILLKFFADRGIGFLSAAEQMDVTRPDQMLTVHLLASFAEHERRMTSARITEKIYVSRSSGRYLGIVILGYDRDPVSRRLVVNLEEAKIVLFIFQRFTETKSMAVIAREANALGYTTKRLLLNSRKVREARAIRDEDIGKWLRNSLYIGKVKDHARNIEYDGIHEPIISQEIWDRVQEILTEDLGGRQGRSRQRTPGFLRELAACGHCDCHMRPALTSRKKDGTVYRYYVCYNAVNRGYHSCPLASVPADMLEGYALERLQTVLQQPEVYAETWRTAQQKLQQEIGQLQATEKSLQTRFETLRLGLSAGAAIEDAAVGDMHLDLVLCERQLAETRDKLRECKYMVVTETALVQALSRIDALWGFLQEHEKARLFQLVFKKVVVRSDQIEVQFRDNGLSNLVRELEITGD